jgi:thiol-disulfide isomerase/thioredoxin
MKPVVRNTVLGIIAVFALAAGYFASRMLAPKPEQGGESSLVDFSLPDLGGKTRWMSEWQGKVIVLNFWATWCAPCREEIPLLIKAQQRFGGDGVQVIGVAIDNRDAVTGYARDMRFNYPLLLAEESGLPLMARYGNTRGLLPYTVIIGRDGSILNRKLGAYGDKELAETIKSLVKADS